MNPITTASKLKTLRNLKGLSPEQLAEKASLNISDYKALEEGKTAVQIDKLTKACDALGVDIKEWFETDKSKVYINSGEFKDNVNVNNCENCYFYERTQDETDRISATVLSLKAIIEKLDQDWIKNNMKGSEIKDKRKSKDKE